MTDLLADLDDDALLALGPYGLFGRWFAEAGASEPNDANAMALATSDTAGMTSVRVVLMKDHDARGFVFYTNLESRKGHELKTNPNASINFHWKSLRRQVRAEGQVGAVSDEEADAYFATRPRDSQIGAWASAQSRSLDRRQTFLDAVARETARFDGRPVPRPPHWSGFRLSPKRIEFWQDRPFRLHDRVVFTAAGTEPGAWSLGRLYP